MKSLLIFLLLLKSSLVMADTKKFVIPQDILTIISNSIKFNLGDRKGNGGGLQEMQVVNFGWQIADQFYETDAVLPFSLDRFVKALTALNIHIVDEIQKNKLNRDGYNFPDTNEIYLTKKVVSQILDENIDYRTRAQFFLHEFLPLVMEENDQGYRNSRIAVKILEKNRNKNTPVELFKAFVGDDRNGISYRDAKKICSYVKYLYQEKYFVVYCTYFQKSWDVFHTDVYEKRWFHKYKFRSPRFSEKEIKWGWQRHKSIYPVTKSIYGLKVFGLGDVKKLPPKVILDATSGLYLGYATVRQAKRECRKLIITEDDYDFRFYKAFCQIKKINNKYKFVILTQNPLIQD